MDRDPPSEAMKIGIEWHEQLAGYWCNTGWITEPRLKEIPKLLSRFMGVSARNVETEINTPLNRWPDAGWRGHVDLWQYRDGHLEILDYKTVGSVDRERSPEQLAIDPQLISYAFWVTKLLITDCQPYPPEKITLTHCYISRTGKAQTWCTSAEVSWDHVMQEWLKIVDTIELMERERFSEIAVDEPVRSEPLPQPMNTPPVIKTLYLDCMPMRGGAITLEEWLTPILQQIENANGKSWHLMEYRTGTGAVAAMSKSKESPDAMIVNTRSELWPIVSASVLPRYSHVVVAMR